MAPKTGTSMTRAPLSPRRRRAYERRRRAEERSWAAKSGPVVVYYRPVEGPDDLAAA